MPSDRIKIVPLPISDNPHAGDFAKAIIEQMAATFGLTFEQLNGRMVGRVNRFHTGGPVNFRPKVDDYIHPGVRVLRERQERLARRAMDVYRREYASICAIYFLGYDPQRLLEDHRSDIARHADHYRKD
jgi:hypothetical protein